MTQTPDPSISDVLDAVKTLTARFDRLDTLVTKLDLRVEGLSSDIKALDARMERGFLAVEQRLTRVEDGVTRLEGQLWSHKHGPDGKVAVA